MGFFDKIKAGLTKTKENIQNSLNGIFATFRKVDEEFLDELLELLLLSDVGFETAESIIDELRSKAKLEKIEDANVLTTTIGKLANNLKNEGKKVIIAAADTFRAAAIEQIEIWAQRADIEIVKHQDGSDPAAVVYDAVQAAKARNADVVICDTAGRLHNKKGLMDELSKITRVVSKELPDADKEILLVLDATTGQNAIVQAKDFKEATNITGVVLTKLDGTAKGGVTIAVRDVTGVPIKLIGVDEKIDDLQPFSPTAFASALLDMEDK